MYDEMSEYAVATVAVEYRECAYGTHGQEYNNKCCCRLSVGAHIEIGIEKTGRRSNTQQNTPSRTS